MTKNLSKSMLFLFALALCVVVQTAWSQTYNRGVRQGMIKVKFVPSMTETVSRMQVNARSNTLSTGIASFDEKARAVKASNMYRLFPYDAKNEARMRRHGLHLWYVVEIDENIDPKIASYQFAQLPEVAHAETEREKFIAPYTVEPYQPGPTTFDVLPFNDPLLKDQWHYKNTGQTGFGDADINLFKAWEITTGANNIIVAVHDEGVDVMHEDLKGNIWVNGDEIAGNGIDDDSNGYIDDINGFNFAKNKGAVDAQFHGTHVAGTIAAINNNGKGVSGVAGGNGSGNGVKVMSMQILGGGLIERSFVYAANNGAVISQNSWGYTTDGYYDESVREAIYYFIAEAGNYEGSPMRGGIVIFASGNSNSEGAWYPGRDLSILSVSALGPEWKKAPYSNYGEWLEIAAPGGDQIDYPGKNGVLSTIPGNKYAYIQGTSMACPHVSGVAALALANRDKQLTPAELWEKLLTGVVSIDQYNGDYMGKLGSGAIDASLAIRNDEQVSPNAITDLVVSGIAQEFATLSWKVPNDVDDYDPASFTIYYDTEPINESNLNSASKFVIPNNLEAGMTLSTEVSPLLGLTTYYFAVTSTDRWGNTSLISNVPSASTNEGPAVAVSSESIETEIDAGISTTTSVPLTISNSGAGILRWSSFVRHRLSELSFNAAGIQYPPRPASAKTGSVVGRQNVSQRLTLKSNKAAATSFSPIEKSLTSWPTNIIGETDLSLPNSAAAKFYVSEAEGFNLTDVSMYLKHDPAKGPVVVEIFKGSSPTRNNLVYAQEYMSWTQDETLAYIILDEQIYFESGSTFWVAFHIPAGNLFPLGIGYENEPSSSTNCVISFNVGATWQSLEEALNDKEFAWSMTVASYNQFLGTYLTLDPNSGDVNSNEETTVTINADASLLVNGSYSANLVLQTNDGSKPEMRIPVNLTVAGHQPDVVHIDIADFGAGFVGEKKVVQIEFDNQGYGNLSNPEFFISGSDFFIEGGTPFSIAAREKVYVPVSFSPTSAGSKNSTLTITNGSYTYTIALTGVGAEMSKISVSPESQSFDDLTIGDEITAHITVKNTGAYPLKYFIPGYDAKGVSEDWPSRFHKYGYAVRSNNVGETNPITYDFQDISTTGVDITEKLITDEVYFELDMGFSFPYYGKLMKKIFIAQKGFTTFDNTVKPLNTPTLNNPGNPGGFISPLGTFFTYIAAGKIFYKTEANRLIIQYDNVTDGAAGNITAQMVLYVNGDIRFFYDHLGYTESDLAYLNILIENIDKNDGILLHNTDHPISLYDGLALGLDYPGPDIVTSVTNGSGVLSPGASQDVEIHLNTASLWEGQTKRYINFISNDPSNRQRYGLVELNITSGGTPNPIQSKTEIDFGNVFQGAIRSEIVTIKNDGSADVDITSVALANGSFTVDGTTPFKIRPGFFSNYTVTIPTNVTGALADELTFQYAHGATQTVKLQGSVLDPPAISVDLSSISETLNHGDSTSHAFSILNSGIADLEVSTVGKQWMTFRSPTVPDSISYTVEKHNTGGTYQWMDIRRTGVQMAFTENPNDESEYWRDLTLPFAFQYFGKRYTKLKIGENGVISFEENPEMMAFSDSLPSPLYDGAHIMPYWTFGGFNTVTFPKEDVGIFYQFYDDHVIITWSYLVNGFSGMGDPISAQAILYKGGVIKFQYRVEEGGADLTSTATLIGLQRNSAEGIVISNKLALDHRKGLVYTIIPQNGYIVAPGETLHGEIFLTAKHTYGGDFHGDLKIHSNVPGSEILLKPVHLTINGEGTLSAPAEFDFDKRIIAVESGMPKIYFEEVEIKNSGAAPLDISWIETSSGGTQALGLQVYTLIDGWFGPTWEWVDISQLFSEWQVPTPVFSLMPGDQLKARAIFYPTEVGDFQDEIVFTTSVGEVKMSLTGTAVEPPSITVETESIAVEMKTVNDVVNENILFNNNTGKSDLMYSLSIDFNRGAAVTRTNENASSLGMLTSLKFTEADVKSGIGTNGMYHRELRYTDKEVADNHAGTGGSAPFPVATKFNAGPDGFYLSHIETWFRAENVTDGMIEVEIRAGGTSITDAVSLTKESISFNRPSGDQSGGWEQIALQEAIRIYPHEDFYLIVTYPLGIEFPQGVVRNQPATPTRYFYYETGAWFDLQADPTFKNAAWLMYVGEIAAGTTSWLSISSPLTGSIAPGEGTSLSLTIEGAYSQRGDQGAHVVINSNDPVNSEVRIPVNLHMNEAPRFINMPDMLSVAENDTLNVSVSVVDVEGDIVNVTPLDSYQHLKIGFSDNVLSLVLTPGYKSEGNFEYIFKATDEWGAETRITAPVEITHSNQAPQYIGTMDRFELKPTEEMSEYEISSYFEDPDNDAITFVVTTDNSNILEAFTSADKFILVPKSSGETSVNFVVTDSHGAVTKRTLSANIVDTNQAPKFIGSEEGFELTPTGELIEYDVNSYFKDPDNDSLTFSAASGNTEILEIYFSANKFLLKPKHDGETSVQFLVTDARGAATTKALPVKINVILSAEVPELDRSVKVFPNPVNTWLNIQLDSDWGDEINASIADVRGHFALSQQSYTADGGTLSINVSVLSQGVYFLQLNSAHKRRVVKFIKE